MASMKHGSSLIYGYIPGLLSSGLEFILEATTAPTYEQRKRLFNCKLKGLYPFLPGLLQWIFLGGVQDATPLKEYTFEQAKLLQIPEVPEPDSGPAEVWRWSHLELDSEQFVWSVHCRELCAWGYVMWDNARLDKSDIYSQPFTLPPLPDEQELERRKDATIASMVKRRQLFREGAKGWWDVLEILDSYSIFRSLCLNNFFLLRRIRSLFFD